VLYLTTNLFLRTHHKGARLCCVLHKNVTQTALSASCAAKPIAPVLLHSKRMVMLPKLLTKSSHDY
jgi:hypothetical protein